LQCPTHINVFDTCVTFLHEYKYTEGKSSVPYIMLPYATYTVSQDSEIELSILITLRLDCKS